MQDASLALALLQSQPLGAEVTQETAELGTPTAVLDLKSQMSIVRRGSAMQRRKQQQEKEDKLQMLLRHCEEVEGSMLEFAFDVVPELHILRSSLHYVPHHSLLLADVVPNTYPEMSVGVASFAKQHSRTLSLSASLRQDWQRRHQTIGVSDGEADAPRSSKNPTLCCQYGLCLCNPMGKKVLSLRNHFLKLLKTLVSTKVASDKACLQEGWLVVMLKQEVSTAEKPSWSACASDVLEEDLEDRQWAKAEEIWLHIAMQYFSPYRPTFQRLLFETREDSGRIRLRQTGHFLSEFRLWNSLELDSTWNMKLFSILGGAAPLPFLTPSVCWVEEWKQDAPQVWPAPSRGRKRGSKDQGPRRKRAAPQSSRPESSQAQSPANETTVAGLSAESDPESASSGPEDEAVQSAVEDELDSTDLCPGCLCCAGASGLDGGGWRCRASQSCS